MNGELLQAAEGGGYQVLLTVGPGNPSLADNRGPKTPGHFDQISNPNHRFRSQPA